MNVQGTPVKKKARPAPKSRQICFQSPHSSTSTESEGFVETMEVENSFIEPDEEVDIEPLVFMFEPNQKDVSSSTEDLLTGVLPLMFTQI